MGSPVGIRLDLSHIIARFPDDAALIRRLVLKSEMFRGICEEYKLARESLSWFEGRPDAPNRPEIADFRSIISGLEWEIEQLLAKSRPHILG
jgi:hypothetical protein